MELTNEQYAEYDKIVAETYSMVFAYFGKDTKIKVKYKEGVMENYLLKILTSFVEISQKELYVSTNIFTYLKLKRKYKQIKFSFSGNIDLNNLMLNFCNRLKISPIKIEEVYNAYYKD